MIMRKLCSSSDNSCLAVEVALRFLNKNQIP